jgi:hypothetical protein
MATAMDKTIVEEIGEMAGHVWHLLNEHGSMSVAGLTRGLAAPRDSVLQAIGWLAREDKIVIEQKSRGLFISLSSRE